MTKMITPKKNIENVRLIFLLDRSGSMSSIATETISSFNSYVEDQKALPGKATLTLIQFDNQYEVKYVDINVSDVTPLDKSTFVPRGYTALYDAIGTTVNTFLKEESDSDLKTIFVIMTDGEENASKEYNYLQVKELIQTAESRNWDVLFLGANMNAQAVGAQMGISSSKSVTFAYDSIGAENAIKSVSIATSALRGQSFAYADDNTTLNSATLDMSKLYNSL